MTTDHLDPLLAAWAADQHLSDDRADDMLRAVLATPRPVPMVQDAGLPATWWGDFGARLSEVMLQATGALIQPA